MKQQLAREKKEKQAVLKRIELNKVEKKEKDRWERERREQRVRDERARDERERAKGEEYEWDFEEGRAVNVRESRLLGGTGGGQWRGSWGY